MQKSRVCAHLRVGRTARMRLGHGGCATLIRHLTTARLFRRSGVSMLEASKCGRTGKQSERKPSGDFASRHAQGIAYSIPRAFSQSGPDDAVTTVTIRFTTRQPPGARKKAPSARGGFSEWNGVAGYLLSPGFGCSSTMPCCSLAFSAFAWRVVLAFSTQSSAVLLSASRAAGSPHCRSARSR
jgi:hypothetical protein